MFGRKTSEPAVLLSNDGRILATFVADQSDQHDPQSPDVDITTPIGPRTAPAPVREKSRVYEPHLFDDHGNTAPSADGRCRTCQRIRETFCETSAIAVCRVPKKAFAELAQNRGLTVAEVRATYYRGINRLLIDAGAEPIPGYGVEAPVQPAQPQVQAQRSTVQDVTPRRSVAPTGILSGRALVNYLKTL